MKKTLFIGIIISMIGISMLGGCASKQDEKDPNQVLTVASSISATEDPKAPLLLDSVKTIDLTFSEALDPKTVEGIKLYRINAAGNPVEEPGSIQIDPGVPTLVHINNKAITSFAAGEEYKLVVADSVKSTSGKTLEKEYVGYFATNHTFLTPGTAVPSKERSKIVVISDMHMGVDDAFAECRANREPMIAFLKQVQNSPDVKELVIAGDLVDEWFLPMDFANPKSEGALADAIVANNKPIFDELNAIIKDGNIKVTYVNGNHDILVTEADIQRALPGVNQVRENVQGLGTYICGPNSEVAIEHGHRYNFFCAPDPISNREITKNNTSILPPGYFFTRIATSSVKEGFPKSNNTFPEIKADKKDASQYRLFLYAKTWEGVLSILPVEESFNDKVIKTNIDGFTTDYAINDLLPQQDPKTGIIDVTLFKGIQETWEKRQQLCKVAVPIGVEEAIAKANDNGFTDMQSKMQYFDVDASRRIVIFGHTHIVQNITFENLKGQKTIYANAGTWIDRNPGHPTMTMAVVTPASEGSAIETVNIYKWSADNTIIQWQDAQAITTY